MSNYTATTSPLHDVFNEFVSTYTPNFADPRVRRRAEEVASWAKFSLNHFRPREIDKKTLDRVFGPSGNALSQHLRAEVLLQYGRSYMPGQYCKRYLLNTEGVERLLARLDGPPAEYAYYVRRHGDELSALDFVMREAHHRLYHPLQNIARDMKQEFWQHFGLPFDYDLQACAPTILFQCARNAHLPEILMGTLRGFLDNRAPFRAHVANLTGLDPRDAKRLINSLFNGAKLAANPFCAAFRLLGRDVGAMRRLQADPQVRGLVRDIRRVWARLELAERLCRIPSLGTVLAGPVTPYECQLKTSKQKWEFYFQREREVLDVIRAYLRRTGNRNFTEHDGFRSERKVDVLELEGEIFLATGMRMHLDGPGETVPARPGKPARPEGKPKEERGVVRATTTTTLHNIVEYKSMPGSMAKRPYEHYPEGFPKHLRLAYNSQRCTAGRRGIDWQLTKTQWLQIWVQSGHLHERGNRKGQFVMARLNDTGPYALGNIGIQPVEDNVRTMLWLRGQLYQPPEPLILAVIAC